ncbi:MAG: hypothetical protein RLZZ381_2441 [Cyanobacteriota bacterium]|jgi:hypothetical protein
MIYCFSLITILTAHFGQIENKNNAYQSIHYPALTNRSSGTQTMYCAGCHL